MAHLAHILEPLLVCALLVASPTSGNQVGMDQVDTFCPYVQLVPEQQRDLARKLCSLEESIAAINDVLVAIVDRLDSKMDSGQLEGGQQQQQAVMKRKNEFIRFGKRKNEFIRFGRSGSGEQPVDNMVEKRKNEFIRFG